MALAACRATAVTLSAARSANFASSSEDPSSCGGVNPPSVLWCELGGELYSSFKDSVCLASVFSLRFVLKDVTPGPPDKVGAVAEQQSSQRRREPHNEAQMPHLQNSD